MTQPLLLTTTFEHVNGIAEDRVVNTFPIMWNGSGSVTATETDAIFAAIENFWNDAQIIDSVGEYLSVELSRAADAMTYRIYSLTGHLDGSGHGSPIDTDTSTLDAIQGTLPFPSEIACVLTTRATGWESALVETPDGADPGSLVDRPRQRLSGRVFIGPLQDVCGAMQGSVMRVNSELIADLLEAAVDFAGELDDANCSWSVWSRVNAALVPIVDVQCDNAFDVQRRRGADASTRTTRAV